MTNKAYIVTGGGGFVGASLCKSLRKDGHRVISIARGEYPQLRQLGVECVRADIGTDVSGWCSVFSGVDGVFHTAAKVDMWGRKEEFYQANVEGTRNVVRACRQANVRNLVLTSSPSVVHTGADLINVNEQQPIAKHFDAYYPETKALSEIETLTCNDSDFKVVALRPHLIWGPSDTNLIPAVLERARSGALRRVGDGSNLVDLTYIDDCVAAHRCAMKTLEEDSKRCEGKAYFISQGDPIKLWEWIDQILVVHGLPKVSKSVPVGIAMKVATLCEIISRTFLKFGLVVPPRFSRFLVSEMATNHYFDISAARRDLGYTPSMSVSEAMRQAFG